MLWVGSKVIVMASRRHTQDQIIGKLAEGHELMAGGMESIDVGRQLESTWHSWLNQYGDIKADEVTRRKNSGRRTSSSVAPMPAGIGSGPARVTHL